MKFNKVFRALLFLPLLYWVWTVFSDNIGADPAKELNHMTGEISLYFLLANLIIGILIAFKLKWPSWLRFLPAERRWLGVINFLYVLTHIGFYFLLEGFEAKAWTQIYTKNYLIFGSLAWLSLFILAMTSNNFSVRKIGGKRWKKLHRVVYLAALLVTFHVLSIEKADLVQFGSIFLLFWLAEISRWAYLFWQRSQKAQTQ